MCRDFALSREMSDENCDNMSEEFASLARVAPRLCEV
jgi:hypothetical protein